MTSPSSEMITLDADGVLTLPISTADNGTALDHDLVLAGTEALLDVTRGVRDAGAILLTGAGKNFCAGGNVAKFAEADDRAEYLRGLADDLHRFIKVLYQTRLPVVAAVSGWAAGAGMSLVLHADVAVGGTRTRLRPAYPGIGLSPDGGMSWALPRTVGAARARHIIMTDQIIDAARALDLGILAEVVEDDAVADTARATAAKLAAGPRGSFAAIRDLVHASASRTLTDQMDAEAASISSLSTTGEGVEGVDAFLAKRAPDFRAAR
ncbi:enoyl-CoA hydratase/isomerase family protein [Gordonia malaquae]|uniref:Putative enoyl-CoA hydratase n=1 Tax=Gordonia malaquae NBRC 108250 TaxID=1223542 RepID=M3VC50_GORML|nr:enoyl-CoA hydratase-related protein [Gordonia malaquae]GAC81398.1 putative enoyl-CoA hydratase [Gordonia malaquae NBRC 108250]SED74480.1 2-(1,2-epoxy-1,2-dihydrophenyl)acetyl-CoA isomerase [Gordonia malaquae]